MRRALITGITGQDGSYLAEFLLAKDYEVHGIFRNPDTLKTGWLAPLIADPAIHGLRLFTHAGDLEDPAGLRRILEETAPEEVYHLAGASHVGQSFANIEDSCRVTAMGTLRLLTILEELKLPARFFNASTSEVFGRPAAAPQDELTPFRPVTPYGCAKAFGTQLVSIYRQSFGLFACNGILYNHESPRRGGNFVTQKICRAAAAIKEGRQKELSLGNLTAQRDWGDARDYVRGMWLALQHDTPEDFVFATGFLHSIEDLLETAFGAAGLNWRDYVQHDPKLLRTAEPGKLVGNPEKARRLLGWERKNTFQGLITEMTRAAFTKQD
jgi:GDPmannose 4,6-dehydratase